MGDTGPVGAFLQFLCHVLTEEGPDLGPELGGMVTQSEVHQLAPFGSMPLSSVRFDPGRPYRWSATRR